MSDGTIEIEYRCADGTPFPVTFEDEDQAAQTWRLEREHYLGRQVPLAMALHRLGGEGSERAYAEVDMIVPPPFVASSPDANGFAYFSTAPMTDEALGQMITGCARLVEVHGSGLGVWRDYCLPRTKDSVAFLEAAEPGTATLRELAEVQSYGQQMTMIPAFVCGGDLMLLAGICAEVVGQERSTLVAHELAQGYENETLLADQALWECAQDPTPERVDAFLAEFGHRSEAWEINAPTWDERPDGFYRQLEAVGAPGTPAPRAAVEEAAKRRTALFDELDAKFADDGMRARFRRRVDRIAPYVAVREERARWQLALTGALRHAVLRIGRGLVDGGVIDRPDDVLYLLPDEIEGQPTDRRALAAGRRAEHERWCALTPPLHIGSDSPSLLTSVPDMAPKSAMDDGITGVGASRGVAVGRARVVTDLADADRVEPGDVLVCVMTSPPWTPLFGVVSAVVVDSGDIGSHPAIAAREYGIPCVLATDIATATIPDGATVEVDGDAGTVKILRS